MNIEALKHRDILSKYKTKLCKKPSDQCKFKFFNAKDSGEIVVLCTGSHNVADDRRSPFIDSGSSSLVYIGELCE